MLLTPHIVFEFTFLSPCTLIGQFIQLEMHSTPKNCHTFCANHGYADISKCEQKVPYRAVYLAYELHQTATACKIEDVLLCDTEIVSK